MKLDKTIREKEIHTEFHIVRNIGVGPIYGHIELKHASIKRGARFMDFSKAETIISLN